jgi:hypothetical protein
MPEIEIEFPVDVIEPLRIINPVVFDFWFADKALLSPLKDVVLAGNIAKSFAGASAIVVPVLLQSE